MTITPASIIRATRDWFQADPRRHLQRQSYQISLETGELVQACLGGAMCVFASQEQKPFGAGMDIAAREGAYSILHNLMTDAERACLESDSIITFNDTLGYEKVMELLNRGVAYCEKEAVQ